jgi:hypothetical protein
VFSQETFTKRLLRWKQPYGKWVSTLPLKRMLHALYHMVSKKLVLGVFLTGILFCALSYVALGDPQASAVQGWQIEDRGGYCSESGGVIRF